MQSDTAQNWETLICQTAFELLKNQEQTDRPMSNFDLIVHWNFAG